MPHAVSPASSPPATEGVDMQDAPASSNGAQEPTTQPQSNVEDIFDDGDSDPDDEFSSSAPRPSSQSSPPAALSMTHTIKASDPETLLSYYSRLFPFRSLFHWLNGSPSPARQFTNREFAFVLPNDAYIRYQSFPTWEALRKQCLQMTPVRFEIGPEYTLNPRDRKSVRKQGAFRPISKELVFDIDMTDYDEIRTCCSGASICGRCWAFITMAIRVIDKALREDFGFKHLLWVYSGRRGAHCWVSDRRARLMDDATRRAVAGYLEVLKGGGQGQKRVNPRRPLHPHLERSLNLLNPYFTSTILAEQDPFSQPEQSKRLLSLLGDPTLSTALQKKWDSTPGRTSAQKWADIDALASTGNLTIEPKKLTEVKQDIRLEYTYPRLDAEVSKKLNHLLKSPFVVHPATGRVCVPIDVGKVEEFDPLGVPTVGQLLGEIDEWGSQNGGTIKEEGEERMQDWQKTSLRPYVEYFKGFVEGVMKEENEEKKRRREDGEGMEF